MSSGRAGERFCIWPRPIGARMVLALATAILLCSIAALAQPIAGPAAPSLQQLELHRRWLPLETSELPAQYSKETSSPHARQLRPVSHPATPQLPPPPPPPPPPPQQQSSSASRQRRQLIDYPGTSPLAVLAKARRRRQLQDSGPGLPAGDGEEGDEFPEITFGPNGEGPPQTLALTLSLTLTLTLSLTLTLALALTLALTLTLTLARSRTRRGPAFPAQRRSLPVTTFTAAVSPTALTTAHTAAVSAPTLAPALPAKQCADTAAPVTAPLSASALATTIATIVSAARGCNATLWQRCRCSGPNPNPNPNPNLTPILTLTRAPTLTLDITMILPLALTLPLTPTLTLAHTLSLTLTLISTLTLT